MQQPKVIFCFENLKNTDLKALYCRSISCSQHFLVEEIKTNRLLPICFSDVKIISYTAVLHFVLNAGLGFLFFSTSYDIYGIFMVY